MKKIFIIFLIFFSAVSLIGCSNDSDNQIDVDLSLDIYETVTEGNTMSFEFSKTIIINSTYEIISIEKLNTIFGEFPYESYFINEREFSTYLNGVETYLSQISVNSINESMGHMLGPKAKLIITLSDGSSDIEIHFFQDESNEISGSMIAYTDYQSIEFKHYFRDDDEISYFEINEVI